ncbi:MAG TPA: integrin alpha, partial [Isosphaeraceae bacterium]
MFHSKRGVRASRRRRVAYRAGGEGLEDRALMAQAAPLDLLNVASKPLGVEETGVTPLSGSGWKVADVGDVNGDGWDDWVIAAPTVATSIETGFPVLGQSGTGTGPNTSQVFLIFGSLQVNVGSIPSIVDYLSLNAQQRVGDLTATTISGVVAGGLGTTTQVNPTNATATGAFQFSGITFTVGANTNPIGSASNINFQLGASITPLGDINGDGFADFLIGAPGAPDSTGLLPGAGRAYLVYGGSQFSTANPGLTTEALDNPTPTLPPIVTFVTAQPGAALGSSGADGIFFTDSTLPDLAIGAPGALNRAGETFVLKNSGLPQGIASPTPAFGSETINVDTTGQTGSLFPGTIFTGQTAGDQSGFSLAMVGDVSHSTTNTSQSDLLIGAPQNGFFTGLGAPNGLAYFINANTSTVFTNLASTVGGLTSISLSQVAAVTSTGVPTTNQVPGAVFTTSSAAGNQGFQIGYSVATAGTINGGPSFMIGAPIWDRLFLFTNQGTTAPRGFINLDQLSLNSTGTQPTTPTPTIPVFTIFTGGAMGITGDLVGWSETAVGSHTGSTGV